TSAAMTMNDRFHNLNAMGTGKTKSAIWAYHFLKTDGLADKMLVAAPLSTLNFTWAREIMNTIPSLRVRVLIGDAEKRRKLLAEDADIYIINHAGLRIISNELRLRPDITVYCFDEAAAYRNAQTERSNMARFVSQDARYVWGMTGSPTPTEPTDAYGLARLITPHTAPHSYLHFRQAVMK